LDKQFTISSLLQYVIAFLASLIIYGVFTLSPAFARLFIWFCLLFSAFIGLTNGNRNASTWIYSILMLVVPFIIIVYRLKIDTDLGQPFWQLGLLSFEEIRVLLDKLEFFFHPTVIELFIILFALAIFRFGGKAVFRGIVQKSSNYYFEFVVFTVPNVEKKVMLLVSHFVRQFVLVFVLALAAFYLLGIKAFFAFALLFGLFSLIPYFGLFLGGLFIISMLPASSNIVFQIVGIVISAAVIWLFRFIFLGEESKLTLPVLYLAVFFLVILANYVLFGLTGFLLCSQIYIICILLIQAIAQAAPLLHHPNNLLRKILLT
jgi:hypothetical protein